MRVKFAEPKGASNVTTEQLIQNYSSLQDFLVKLYFGESPTDDDHVKAFMSDLARMHLPMINFDKIDEIFKSTKEISMFSKYCTRTPLVINPCISALQFRIP